MNSSQRHCQQRFKTFDIKKHSSVEEIRRFDYGFMAYFLRLNIDCIHFLLNCSEVMVELGESLTKEMIAAIMLRQSFQPEVI